MENMSSNDIKRRKQELREKIVAARAGVDETIREHWSNEIVRRLLTCETVQRADVIMAFLSFGTEVNLDRFIDECYKAGKRVYLPKTLVKERKIEPCRFTGWEGLTTGSYGIREPGSLPSIDWQRETIDVIIMPGVAFTKRGERIGYGGGYYDRFLSRFPEVPPLFAACYQMQIVSDMACEPHDIRMQKIVTEEAEYDCSLFCHRL
ncbi:5-formyltetrahydrofolate cyclo-ligase [Aneurinibacillus terranovensis]|uniref:5-formyltetrahydrofolate cyclo-ligase n=1 Tax=Aneurinibacillus terranovensis TaxID=278991 RepID=UPI00042798A6|nr:5-formyltetrahydrofolate cyclo-ligase [Aneurinibacillus terranovensis]